jgi:DNA polymerase I/DNA polymerase-2
MKIVFVPLDYDSVDINGKTYVRVFGREIIEDKDKSYGGKRVCLIDECEAYFYGIPKKNINLKKYVEKIERVNSIGLENAGREIKVETKIVKKNHLGKEVEAVKIIVNNPKDIHSVVEYVKELDETEMKREVDINYITRYIIDKKIKPLNLYEITGEIVSSDEFGGMVDILDVDLVIKLEKAKEVKNEMIFIPKVMAFDIEADEFEIGKGEVLMISLSCGSFKKVITWKSVKGKVPDYVEVVKSEKEMIERFVEQVKKQKPDILVSYFGDGFDMPYLKARAEKHKIKLNLGLDGSNMTFKRGRISSAEITGIVHVDLFRFIETVYSQYLQSETLGLGDIASELIGETKRDFGKENLGRKTENFHEKDWIDYFDYNMQDSAITEKLFMKIWADMLEFTKVIGEPLFEIVRDGMSQHVENYILHNLERFNEIALNRPTRDRIEDRLNQKKYEGAFVLQPKPGLYENIGFFDFTSMYASVIVSFNLSLSTILEKKEKESNEIDLDSKKVYFSKKKGFMPAILEEIIDLRKKYKKELKEKFSPIKKARSNAFKLLANAFYGYNGFYGARYYCREAAASAAALARKFVKDSIDKTNSEGFDVVYGDTDGFCFLMNKHSQKDAFNFLEKLNAELPGIMEIELEDFYKRGLFVTKRTGEFGAKKKYALITYENKIKIRGFETVRRDWCTLARELQDNVLDFILEKGDAKEALVYTKKIILELKERKIDKKKLIIKTQLKKPINEYLSVSPHVVAATKMKEKGIPVDVGMIIEYFVAETREKKSLVREKVKLPDEKGEYNIEYYLNNQILPAVENIFAVFGVEKSELAEGKKQKKLGEF